MQWALLSGKTRRKKKWEFEWESSSQVKSRTILMTNGALKNQKRICPLRPPSQKLYCIIQADPWHFLHSTWTWSPDTEPSSMTGLIPLFPKRDLLIFFFFLLSLAWPFLIEQFIRFILYCAAIRYTSHKPLPFDSRFINVYFLKWIDQIMKGKWN